MRLFYTPNITQNQTLTEEESAHAVRVLRLKDGDEIFLTDGKGVFYQAIIVKASPKQTQLQLLKHWVEQPLWTFYLHIAIAPTKNMDRMEWFTEKVTEIGVDAITCLRCRYSERREIKTTRLEKVMISAMKQSQKASLPILEGMTNFQDFVKRPFDGRKFIAHCENGEKPLLKQTYHPGEKVLILIGPEGDFSPDEIEYAQLHDFEPISLGKSRLRTETAALTACQTIHILNQ